MARVDADRLGRRIGYEYIGDVDLFSYGGKFIKVDGSYPGEVIDIIASGDLENDHSGKPYVLVVKGYIYSGRPMSEWRQIIASCGWLDDRSRWTDLPRAHRRLMLLEACAGYYGYDGGHADKETSTTAMIRRITSYA